MLCFVRLRFDAKFEISEKSSWCNVALACRPLGRETRVPILGWQTHTAHSPWGYKIRVRGYSSICPGLTNCGQSKLSSTVILARDCPCAWNSKVLADPKRGIDSNSIASQLSVEGYVRGRTRLRLWDSEIIDFPVLTQPRHDMSQYIPN